MKNILSHGTAVLLAAFLVMMGVQKFGAENIVFAQIAEKSGIALFEPAVRTLVGVAELAVAALLVLPRTRALGVLGAAATIGGAILFHLSPWLGISVVLEKGAEPSPALFFMAVGSFVLTGVTYLFNKRS